MIPVLERLPYLQTIECADCGEFKPSAEFKKKPKYQWSYEAYEKSCRECREFFTFLEREHKYRTIWNVFGMHCTFCKKIVSKKKIGDRLNYKWEAHLDHIIPKSKGGSDLMFNRQLLCFDCNVRIKGNSLEGDLIRHLGKKTPGSLIELNGHTLRR